MINHKIRLILDSHFQDYTLVEMTGGSTEARLYGIETAQQGRYVLKHQADGLKNDCLNYQWLRGKAPVPEVVFYEAFQNEEWLCLSYLDGYTLDGYIGKMATPTLVMAFAAALKTLHSVAIDETAVVQNIDQKLAAAAHNVAYQRVNREQLEAEYRDIDLNNLLEIVQSLKPYNFENVFTHGDYCFDNVIFKDNQLSGFIDMGRGGVADKYQDIALAVRSIEAEFGAFEVDLFYKTYGITKVDDRKLQFYRLLDEFF